MLRTQRTTESMTRLRNILLTLRERLVDLHQERKFAAWRDAREARRAH